MRNRIMACALLAAAPAAAQDGEEGFNLFQQNCRTCHVMKEGENRLGPSLNGVIGREIGSVEGFAYSDGMAGAGATWDEASLSAFIENPTAAYPGTRMLYPGMPDAADREAVIAYIVSESGGGAEDAAAEQPEG